MNSLFSVRCFERTLTTRTDSLSHWLEESERRTFELGCIKVDKRTTPHFCDFLFEQLRIPPSLFFYLFFFLFLCSSSLHTTSPLSPLSSLALSRSKVIIYPHTYIIFFHFPINSKPLSSRGDQFFFPSKPIMFRNKIPRTCPRLSRFPPFFPTPTPTSSLQP